LQPLLDEASDKQCCRNNGFKILYSFYTLGSTGKPKGMVHTTAGYMVYTAYTLKMFSIMKKTISFGVQLILVGLQVILIFCMALIERSNNSDF
jgi:acyl-coenzyme A synthetase/AMP-(fatty) acid ligase